MSGLDNPTGPDSGEGQTPASPPPRAPAGPQGQPAAYAYSQPAYPSGPQPYDAPYTYPGTQSGNGLALTAMVLGLVGVVLSWVPIFDFLLAALAIVFGALGISSAEHRGGAGKGMAIAGVVLGLVTLAVSIVLWVLVYSILNTCYGAGC